MSEINLEKVDLIRERTGVTYSEAKEALEANNGDVVEALVYLESMQKSKGNFCSTREEFTNWIKDIINKGNVTRIKLKKDDKVLVDLPVNAGIAMTGIIAAVSAPLFALGVISAVVTKITVEITKEDGSVEVVNSYFKDTMGEVKDKFSNITDKIEEVTGDVKDKINEFTDEIKDKFNRTKDTHKDEEENVYKYTVKFEEVDEEKSEEKSDK